MKKIGIAGAGLVGRLLALELMKYGCEIALFDKDLKNGENSCGFVAAGMLSLLAEVESSNSIIYDLGVRSMKIWPEILKTLDRPTHFQVLGSIIVAHESDYCELERFLKIISKKNENLYRELQFLNKEGLNKLESELNFMKGIYLPFEGNIDNHQLYENILYSLLNYGVSWHEKTIVDKIYPTRIVASGISYNFDVVFDCRGLGAKSDLLDLRGVRGEILTLYAPNVTFNRPVRVAHPKYRIYVVPRPNNIFVIGASEIESSDMSEISLQSALELLSSAFILHKGFAESRIIRMQSHCRPSFPSNLPRIYISPGLIRINGLYRNGYLIAPLLVKEAISMLFYNKTTIPEIIYKEELTA